MYGGHACLTNLTFFGVRTDLLDGDDDPQSRRDSKQTDTHLRVGVRDVRAAGAVGRAGSGQGGARYVKHVFGGRSLEVLAVLKTHLGAGRHDADAAGGGGGRQASDIYRAGGQQ